MDYEERLARFEQAYEAEQEMRLGLNDEYPGQLLGQRPSGWHPVVIDDEVVDIGDYLVTDDYARRARLLDEGVDMWMDPNILISYETDEMERLIGGRSTDAAPLA